ncbi:ANTAR domain-containing protein [Geomonas sp. RF6]|uniref:ANTAR domain-containing response regulator n=1 Tax=Geomonas sp. RF6 TaxID=2897342 RepID=UPI001E647539|nr:ANTAR domain-containing protein [Geomonas sp. RF6]UFS71007.1 ANTAR domain-containing protein [Geomonas sp. RF6]
MRKAVLCVHDEKMVGSLKKRLHEQSFAEIILCDSAGETAETALEKLPALVLLESTSPAGEIATAAERIRSVHTMPIIVIAEQCSADDISQAAGAGVSAILTKPVRDADLSAAVELTLAASREVAKLTEEVSRLKDQIEARKVVEKAKGRLMERDKLTEAEAFRRMQRLAMDRRISMRQLAEAILLTDRIGH